MKGLHVRRKEEVNNVLSVGYVYRFGDFQLHSLWFRVAESQRLFDAKRISSSVTKIYTSVDISLYRR